MNTFLDFITAFCEEFFRLFGSIIESLGEKHKPGHRAEFMQENKLLSAKHVGFRMTGAKSISAKLAYTNAAVIGPTGTGKSASILIPTLLSANASFVVNDPSGELYDRTAAALIARGYEVRVLNFSAPEKSSGYNFILRARTQPEQQKLAHALIDTSSSGKGGDKFWESIGVGLLSNLVGILKTQRLEYQTLYNVRTLLNAITANEKGIRKLFEKYAGDVLYDEFMSFLGQDEKIVSSAISTVKAATQIFADEGVAKLTSFDTLDFSQFRKKPMALFIQTNTAQARYFAGLSSLFYEQFFADLLAKLPDAGNRDIFFLLDEASSLKIPTLPLALANLRKYRVGIMICIQSESQLETNYGKADAESILANCVTKLYFPGQDLRTTQRLESLLGKTEVKDDEGKKSILPLMTADAIRTMQPHQALILSGANRPVLARMVPYYEQPAYRRQCAAPAPAMRCQIPFFNIPLLDLPEVEEDADDHEEAA